MTAAATTSPSLTHTLASSDDRSHATTTVIGFWVYIATDCVLFAALFATFAVLRNSTADGPAVADVARPGYSLVETLVLLCSSFVCGLGWVAATRGQKRHLLAAYTGVIALGLAFIVMEFADFHSVVSAGNGWTRSAAMSAYFTLVGTHGLHVTVGLIWLAVILFRTWRGVLGRSETRRFLLFSVFWHFLDVIWVFIFTIVYLAAGAHT